ncbi:hypothetical protein C7476_13621 [Phyllobacterium bourgognense]|uniref:Lipoprotein n=1 Tax=Phyllobacterium bourgognense TaxID=314236 RepID=A0A368YG38_9HYPH|nr:hypothetical protein C7476_13621 [Phyllobacterium bourgognense]
MLVFVNRSKRRMRAFGALFGLLMAATMPAGCREETKEPAPLKEPTKSSAAMQPIQPNPA